MKEIFSPFLKIKNSGLPCCPVVKNSPSTAGDTGSTPGWATKIPHAVQCGQKKKKRRRDLYGRKVLTFFTGKAAGVSQVREAEDVRERGRVQMEGDLH